MKERHDAFAIGAYAFLRPESDGGGEEDGRIEAQDFARTMLAAGVPDNFVIWGDLEHGGLDDANHSVQQNCDFLAAWVEVCENELGRSPWIYTGTNTWRKHMGWTMRFKHLPLVDADYRAKPDRPPWPWTLWQFTSEGSVPGIEGNVDISRFPGTIEELRELERPLIRQPVRGPILPPLDRGSAAVAAMAAVIVGVFIAASFFVGERAHKRGQKNIQRSGLGEHYQGGT